MLLFLSRSLQKSLMASGSPRWLLDTLCVCVVCVWCVCGVCDVCGVCGVFGCVGGMINHVMAVHPPEDAWNLKVYILGN